MTAKTILVRFAGLILMIFTGFVLMAVTFHLTIMLGLAPQGEESAGFGRIVVQKTMLLSVLAAIIGVAGIFIKPDWRWTLYLAPLYAPSLFIILLMAQR
jgi:hypothetical protein